MCGIVGYLGPRPAAPLLIEGLKKLEYRGYDSAGITVLAEELQTVKTTGKLKNLEQKLNVNTFQGNLGIGHTRWATHGKPSDTNAHPHLDCEGRLSVVHNGIIENHAELRKWLQEQGHKFLSETDTEVIPHLIEHYYEGDLLQAVQKALSRLEGAYAIVAATGDQPETLVAARKDSPLVIGLGAGENFIASDIPAFLNHTRRVLLLDEGEIAVVTCGEVEVYDREGTSLEKEEVHVDWDTEAAEKGGYPHFMLKEIFEQPEALRKTISPRIDAEKKSIDLPEAEGLNGTVNRVFMVACGTAYHAGLVGKRAVEAWAGLPVEVDIASEFRYREPLLTPETLVVLISQSGETADTLAALREAKRHGAKVLAITNVVGSTISREADHVLYTWAGPEIAVASTKAYVTQLAALFLLAGFLAQERGSKSEEEIAAIAQGLIEMPQKVQAVLDDHDDVKHWAKVFAQKDHTFFIGRGMDHALAMEGALKLKEISYIHAEAYAAGELKHGTLALIEEGIPVIALATQPHLKDKMDSNIKEVKARGAQVVNITTQGGPEQDNGSDYYFTLPQIDPMFSPILTVVPLQLLAYYTSVERGTDVDQPRNLAKSVTVE